MSPNTPAIRTTTRSCRPRRRIHCRRTYPRISTTRLSPDDGAEGRRRMTRPSSSANIASVQSQTRPGGGRSASWCRWGRRKFRYLHTPRCRMHPPLTSPRSWSHARTPDRRRCRCHYRREMRVSLGGGGGYWVSFRAVVVCVRPVSRARGGRSPSWFL